MSLNLFKNVYDLRFLTFVRMCRVLCQSTSLISKNVASEHISLKHRSSKRLLCAVNKFQYNISRISTQFCRLMHVHYLRKRKRVAAFMVWSCTRGMLGEYEWSVQNTKRSRVFYALLEYFPSIPRVNYHNIL
jgi:hypothetical protein